MTTRYRVLIADAMSSRAAEVLAASANIDVDDRGGISADELVAAIGDYHGLLVRSRTKVTADVIAAGAQLRVIGRAGIGVDNIDLDAASRRGVVVENAPSGNAVTTAEHALCLLMSLARHIPQATASMKAGKWEKNKFSGREIMAKTLGIVGLGNIGRIVASRALGLKMHVVAADPFIGAEAAARLGVELVGLDELLARADFITVHTPLTAQTRGIIGAAALAKAKDGVLVVNAARGGVVDEDALRAALDSGKVGGAALDVYAAEPPPPDHPLIAHPRVICTPHLGASTHEAQVKVAVEVAEQMVALLERGEIRNAVNVHAVPAELRQALAPWEALGRRLGSLVGQLARGARGDGDAGFIDELSVEVIGEPADIGEPAGRGAAACTRATLIGLLGSQLDAPINAVNAPLVARDRGLTVSEVKTSRDRDFAAALAVTARAGDTRYHVKGTLFHVGDRVQARLVQIDAFLVEVALEGRLLIVHNENRPGVIGAVGTLLGAREFNVNSLHVGLDRDRGEAIALWNVDAELPADLIDAARALPSVTSAQVIEL